MELPLSRSFHEAFRQDQMHGNEISLLLLFQMRPDIKKYVFHLCWSPESVPADVVRSQLFTMAFNLKSFSQVSTEPQGAEVAATDLAQIFLGNLIFVRTRCNLEHNFQFQNCFSGHRRTDELLGQQSADAEQQSAASEL